MTLASVSEFDADSPKFLRGKYAICGIGETTYRRGSEESTRNLATWAIKNAMDDAGIGPSDIDGCYLTQEMTLCMLLGSQEISEYV